MDISKIRALRGPNIWTRHTAMQAVVQVEPNENLAQMGDFENELRVRFPQIGAWRAVDEPLCLAHVIEHAALAFQAQAGCPVSFSRTTPTPEIGIYQIVVQYTEESVGRQALQAAQDLILATQTHAPFDATQIIRDLQTLDEEVRLGPSTGSIVQAAVAKGIPYRRLTSGSLVQLGWGSKQRRIWAAEVDSTSAVSESIAQDKDLTKNLLRAAGVPVPSGCPVDSFEQAWEAALEMGFPVVMKPQDGNQGKGVTVNITTREGLLLAYQAAEPYGQPMIEKYLPGSDYRLLVVGNQLVAAARRDPPHVIGDGQHTVRELVEQVNADPRRGTGHATSLTQIRFDDIAKAQLASQGYTESSIPTKGERVILRNNANLSTGGTATDVTDDVHPDVAQRAIAAARMVGLDICGVDVVCQSVLKPLEAQGGGVVEVNAAPGLRMHLQPSYGKGRAVGEAIINHMFAPEDNGRIPVVAVTGTNGKTTTARLINHLFMVSGYRVGMTNTDGVTVNGRLIDTGDCAGPKSARNVLMNPDVDAAVFETARGGLLREGLGFDRCQIAVVTNIGEGDHLGLNYITTVEDLAVLKRVIVNNVAESGYAVLNAADPHCVRMAARCPGHVIFFAMDKTHPVMAAHRALGKRCVWVQDNHLVLNQGVWSHRMDLQDVPITVGGKVGFQVENVMAAVAAAWGLNLPWAAIARGLREFSSASHNTPGRFNVMNYQGATIIADYGHNPDAMRALVKALGSFQAKKRSVVISAAGDRRDQDIREQTAILGEAFDEVILYQDACQRGRADGEVLALLQQGLVGASCVKRIETITGEFQAIDRALSQVSSGDMCLILIDQVEASLTYLQAQCGGGVGRQVA